jgi:hypothetical protein
MGAVRRAPGRFTTNANVYLVASRVDDLVIGIQTFLDSTWGDTELDRVPVEVQALETLLLHVTVDLVAEGKLISLLGTCHIG